jgi:hypothetical protein
MKCAIVDSNGVIVNIIVSSPNDPAPEGCRVEVVEQNVYCNPGELWEDRRYIEPELPPVEVPEEPI